MDSENNDLDGLEVTKNEERERFEARVDGKLTVVEYQMLSEDVIDFVHTEVPEELQGRGIADHMAHEVLEYAREHRLEVVPQCPYVADYIRRHPEYQQLVYADWGSS